MKISLKWMSDFVEITEFFLKPEALADVLTKAGLEVEEIHQKAKDFQFVVTGLILEKDKHPNADKLSLCRVTTGEGVVHQIVCGAQNHKAGDRVIVALPGAILPGNFAIKTSAVRGVESGGMLCSLKELGLATESNGIEILPVDAPIGKSFAEYRGFDDVTFELKVTPNRADCLSHFGLAREVACLLGRELKKPVPVFKLGSGSTKDMMALEIKSELCPRYAGRFIRGVKVGASPEWMKKRLESVGMNSINNVVDVTNYVMMELGQPLHAFDAQEIKGSKISVELAHAGDMFTSLDGSQYKLSGEELMIKDVERWIAMAGVVGGKNSGVSETTTDLFLEAASFSPMAVRKASRTHGINTDSGYRFSRGVDPESTVFAMERATQLILESAGGEALGNHYDHHPVVVKKEKIKVHLQTISDRLGSQAVETQLADYLKRLGCSVERVSDGVFEVLPPQFRFDLESEIDFVEEYARLHGYENIGETLPQMKIFPTTHDKDYLLSRKISESLRALGFSQGLNMAFCGSVDQNQFLGDLESLRALSLVSSPIVVQVMNPLGADQNILRQSLSYGLFQNAHHNFHQGQAVGRLFELGSVFSTQNDGSYQESSHLGLMAWGSAENLWVKADYPLVFELKAAVEKMLAQLHVTSYQWLMSQERGEIPDFVHRGQFAKLQIEGKIVGFIGGLHPVLLEEQKIRVPVAVAELNLESLQKSQGRGFKIESFSRFPKAERDLALLMPKALKSGEILREARKLAGPLLIESKVFDVYEGDKLPPGKKSVAFRFQFQDKNGTLQDQTVNDLMNQILSSLSQKFEVSLR